MRDRTEPFAVVPLVSVIKSDVPGPDTLPPDAVALLNQLASIVIFASCDSQLRAMVNTFVELTMDLASVVDTKDNILEDIVP
jgi:hypothetical protein